MTSAGLRCKLTGTTRVMKVVDKQKALNGGSPEESQLLPGRIAGPSTFGAAGVGSAEELQVARPPLLFFIGFVTRSLLAKV